VRWLTVHAMMSQRRLSLLIFAASPLSSIASSLSELQISPGATFESRGVSPSPSLVHKALVRRHEAEESPAPSPSEDATTDPGDGTPTAASPSPDNPNAAANFNHGPEVTNSSANCHAPTVTNASCLEGIVIFRGGHCTPICNRVVVNKGLPEEIATEMMPSVSKLTCSGGILSPAIYDCRPVQKCNAPDSVENALSPACEEGHDVDSDNICSPSCKEGFEAFVPNSGGNNILNCHDGTLKPNGFQCLAPAEAAAAKAADAEAAEAVHGTPSSDSR